MAAEQTGSDLSFLNSVAHYQGLAEELDGDAVDLCSEGWGFDDSKFSDYCASFGHVTDYETEFEGKDLKEIIERQIGCDPQNIGLDIAGGTNGTALRDLIAEGAIGTGLVTNLFDLRTDEVRADQSLHHVNGDIVSPGTWRKIIEWKKNYAPEGFAFIMHRPVGALQTYPPAFYVGATYKLLDMLKPAGVLFTQVPDSLIPSSIHRENVGLHIVCEAIRARSDIKDIVGNGVYLGDSLRASPSAVAVVKK